MTDPRDALLAEAARLLKLDSDTRPCPHGEYSNGTFYHCDKCRGCQVRAWLARYEAERGGWTATNQCDGCRRGQPIDKNGIHRTPGEDPWLGDSMRCTADRYIAARTAPATPGKEDGE